jgi:hypothetical protein
MWAPFRSARRVMRRDRRLAEGEAAVVRRDEAMHQHLEAIPLEQRLAPLRESPVLEASTREDHRRGRTSGARSLTPVQHDSGHRLVEARRD